jgi:Kef-type K+ transport system membrane component KefB
MLKVIGYSFLLMCGMALSLLANLTPYSLVLNTITMICLSYIMIEVGLEFSINKKKLGSYGKDYLVAATTAAFPWIFCTLYFFLVLGVDYKYSLLVGRFAAPTSAGVLFTMLAAMGLSSTWLFKKARILAIFDDLDTILLMIPLQILLVGLRWEVFIIIPISLLLLWLAYKYLHRMKLRTSNYFLLIYAIILTVTAEYLNHSTLVQIEVLLPAFVLGCMLFHRESDDEKAPISADVVDEEKVPASKKGSFYLDACVKMLFMFLVGASLPDIDFTSIPLSTLALHVTIITLLSNLGKLFPIFFYRNEASLKQRFALSIAMFPRGEVGAGVLLLSISYGISGIVVSVAVLSLALNLILTGPFIWIVTKMVSSDSKKNVLPSK